MVKQDTLLLQQWLRTVIMAPGALAQKTGLANHLFGLHEDDVVVDGGAASIKQRLNIYSSGYLARLLDCMYADYPVSKKFMGADLFERFARAYLTYHPSTSFTLYDLGRDFPDFLNKTKPKDTEGVDSAFYALPATLARVERARQIAMRAAGAEKLLNSDDGNNIQDMLFGTFNISIPECLQLLELDFPMKRFFEAVYQDAEYELPASAKSWMAISRKNYNIVLDEITEIQYQLLAECRKHNNYYAAIFALSQRLGTPVADLMADASLWLPYFRKCGFIAVTG